MYQLYPLIIISSHNQIRVEKRTVFIQQPGHDCVLRTNMTEDFILSLH